MKDARRRDSLLCPAVGRYVGPAGPGRVRCYTAQIENCQNQQQYSDTETSTAAMVTCKDGFSLMGCALVSGFADNLFEEPCNQMP